MVRKKTSRKKHLYRTIPNSGGMKISKRTNKPPKGYKKVRSFKGYHYFSK
jgi:hypothetical protein